MDKYLDRVRKQSGSTSKFNIFKGFVDEEVPEMKGNEVHVEYKEPSFFRRIFAWKRKQEIDELDDELTDEEKAKLEAMEGEIEAIEEEESDLEEMEEELEERRESLMSRFWDSISFFKSRSHSDDFEDEFEDGSFSITIEDGEEKVEINSSIKRELRDALDELEELEGEFEDEEEDLETKIDISVKIDTSGGE